MRASGALAIGAVAAAAAAVGGSTSSSHASPTGTPERPQGELRDCRSRGEVNAPVTARSATTGVRLGPLVIRPTAVGRTAGPDWPFVTKAPVFLPARSKVVLAIAPQALSLAAFQHRGRFVSAVRFEACREREPAWVYRGTVGKFTFFPFGIGLGRRSACVALELWVDGRADPIRRVVPVGRRAC